MKYTLNDCLARINQVLNYPSISYEDVYHFFDQAISELNTTLRVSLPSVSEMREEHTFNVTEQDSLIRLTTLPSNSEVIAHYTSFSDLPAEGTGAYVCGNAFSEKAFYKWDGAEWVLVDKLYGIYVDAEGALRTYLAVPITKTVAVWVAVDDAHIEEFDLTEYLPIDWWTLFIIPYVCFKFSVRNGDSGDLFVDEFTQGFQQLQSSYNVPNTVQLCTVAGRPAYSKIVKNNLHNLLASVPTRAIYDSMKVGNGIQPVFGVFYETGGWGI